MHKYIQQSLLSLATILTLSACGEDSASTANTPSTSNPPTPTPTAVTVERGKVYSATVVDSENNIATEQIGKNVYIFDDIPKYPITVTGGWIDVDGDGRKTVADIVMTTHMKSYSTNVTPITTYIADSNITIRENRLNALSTKTGISVEELKKLPSNGTTDAMLVQNSIYKEMKLNDSTNNINLDTVKTSFDTLKTIATQNSDKNSSELVVLIEKEVISNLVTVNKITQVPLIDAIDMTTDEKNQYSLGVNSDDFILSNTLVNFTSISDANLSTDYESNEITFEGINVPLAISIDNANFKIVKNGVALERNSTTVENGDKIKLNYTTNSEFSNLASVTLSIEDKFTNIIKNLNFQNAEKLCSDVDLSLPTGNALKTYYTINSDKFPANITEYWTNQIYNLRGFGTIYNTARKATNGALLSFPYGVICTNHYNDLLFSISTKSDPNQAPIAKAGIDQKVYYTDTVSLSATASSDDTGIVSYEWKDGTTLLSNDVTLTKTDFSVGTHNITLKVTDEGGKTATDSVTVTIFNDFTNLLPMRENGGVKIISSSTINGNTTTTLSSGSTNYFLIANNTKRIFTITKFEIKSTYNGSSTVRVTSSNVASVLGSDKLLAEKTVTLGHTLRSSETANYWTGTYYLTDDATGTTFTNSVTWNGTSFSGVSVTDTTYSSGGASVTETTYSSGGGTVTDSTYSY